MILIRNVMLPQGSRNSWNVLCLVDFMVMQDRGRWGHRNQTIIPFTNKRHLYADVGVAKKWETSKIVCVATFLEDLSICCLPFDITGVWLVAFLCGGSLRCNIHERFPSSVIFITQAILI